MRSIDSIEKRVNKLGVVEPVIQKQGDDRILVQLPGITDIDQEPKSLVEEPGFPGVQRSRAVMAAAQSTLEDYLNDTSRTDFFDTSDAAVY